MTVTTPATTTTTKPTKAEVQQAKLEVQEAKATVKTDEKAIRETKLYAPESGTIASLADDTVGESVSSGSSSSASSDSSDSSTDSSDTSSSSSGFAELVNDKTMTMTVALSEDDISSVKLGQIATVSITALDGVKLAGHVSSISPLGTDSDDVVTYDATVTVTQSNSKVLPGMSATAAIVTEQASGVTVPSEAVSGSGSSATVELLKDGKAVAEPVVVGLKGTSRTQIVSGLKAGQKVQITISLPALGTSTSSTTSTTSATSSFGAAGGATGGSFGGAGGGPPGRAG